LIAKSAIHEHRIMELEQTVQHLNKKKKRESRTRLQSGGMLNVGNAQEMIRQADLAAVTAAQRPRTRAPPNV
jgi:hypothetical protein